MTVFSSFMRFFTAITLIFLAVFIPSRTIFLIFSDEFQFNLCPKNDKNSQSLVCQRNIIKKSVTQGNIATGVFLFKKVISIDSDLDCHTLGHEIGFDVYQAMKKKGLVRIGDPLNYCGYGFWHGFMSGVANDLKNGEKLKFNLADVCQKIVGSRVDKYICYHGFGLGFVGDPPSVDLWGNNLKTVTEAEASCRSITSDSGLIESCYEGVFHQMFQYMGNHNYGYMLPSGNNLYSFCNIFGKESVQPCITQLGPVVTSWLTSDVPTLYYLVNTNFAWLDPDIRQKFLEAIIGGAIHINQDSTTGTSIVFCMSVPQGDINSCLRGVMGGIRGRFTGGEALSTDHFLNLCLNNSLAEAKHRLCVSFLQQYLVQDQLLLAEVKSLCKGPNSYLVCKSIPGL